MKPLIVSLALVVCCFWSVLPAQAQEIAPTIAAQVPDSTKPRQSLPFWLWGSAGLGLSAQSFDAAYVAIGGNMCISRIIFSVQYEGMTLSAGHFGGSDIAAISYLIGWAFWRDKWGMGYIALGPSSVAYNSSNSYAQSVAYTYGNPNPPPTELKSETSIGLGWEAQTMFAFWGIGLGCGLSGNFNSYNTWVGFKLSLHLGWMPPELK